MVVEDANIVKDVENAKAFEGGEVFDDVEGVEVFEDMEDGGIEDVEIVGVLGVA